MSDQYFGYERDERRRDSDHAEYDNMDVGTNEMARNAVERFLESETSEYIAGYESRRRERPARLEREKRAPRAVSSSYVESQDDAWHSSSPAYDGDDEFMTQLANIRRDRPRRDTEHTPTPKPAVRVKEEHHHTPAMTEWTDSDVDWPQPEEDTYRYRPLGEEAVISPREAYIKEPRPRGTVPVHRREPVRSDSGGDGPNPLRLMLAFMFVGVLILMAVLALNNRNLRRDIDTYRAQATRVDDNAVELQQANLTILEYRETIDEYRTRLEQQSSQLNALGHEQPEESNPPMEEDATHSPPSSETSTAVEPTPPPAPEQVIHVIVSGDTLSRIANRHYGSSAQFYIDKIAAANNITNPALIQLGDELIIPPRE
ncbi:MAG: LysM peptidoglycan-binding domain-containing protein [Defluviitaleaceae bacterium]|nr:LysM peptidoglycan-binding domain-containing protein [Defluviitaleaceae bacterium]